MSLHTQKAPKVGEENIVAAHTTFYDYISYFHMYINLLRCSDFIYYTEFIDKKRIYILYNLCCIAPK